MANKYLNRKFTLRESLLLILLAVVLCLGLYFGLVYYPVHTNATKTSRELAAVQGEIAAAEDEQRKYNAMKDELNSMDKSTVMPQYKNNEQQEVLRALFETIFTGIEGYVINYPSITSPSPGVRVRTVSVTFTINEANKGDAVDVYHKVKSILSDLMSTGYRCSMQDLTLAPSGGNDLEHATEIQVTRCSILFYELDS